ncbi:MAG: hypothetical protein QXN37_03020 [Candidatus Anstonellaceae archaeon]
MQASTIYYSKVQLVFLTLLLFSTLLFSFETLSEGKFKTIIDLQMENKTVIAKISYINLSYYSKQLPQNYPNLDSRLNTLPPEFFKPPTRPYSEEYFSFEKKNLTNASLFFTLVLGSSEFKFIDKNGQEICFPAPKTDQTGRTNCTISYFLNASGQPQSIDSLPNCAFVKVSFNGASEGGAEYKSSLQTIMVCSTSSPALSKFGLATALVLSSTSNSWICFPLILILSLLIAGMYYSGRNPLSLFDITTPRLPQGKHAKMKSKASPQMMRSIARKYLQMQLRAEKHASKLVALAVKARGKDAGLSKVEIRSQVNEAKKKTKRIFSDLKEALKQSKDRGLSDAQIADFQRRLAAIFGDAPQGRRAFQVWKKSIETTLPFIQLYNAAYQAYSLTAAGRGSSESLISKKIVTPLFNTLTKKSVMLEELKGIRALGKIPIIKGIINTPTKALDATAQHRSSRVSAVNFRREILGGIFYTVLNRLNMLDKAGAIIKGSPIEKLFKFTHGWTFDKFVAKHDLYFKRFRELFDPVENMRNLTITTYNIAYQDALRALQFSLATKATMGEILHHMQQVANEKNLQDKDKNILKGLLKNLENGQHISNRLLRSILNKLDLPESERNFILKIVSLQDKWSELERRLEAILNAKFNTHADRLIALYSLMKEYNLDKIKGNELDLSDTLRKWRDYEERVIRGIMFARLEGGTYKPISWNDIRNDIKNGVSPDELRKKYLGILNKDHYNNKITALRNHILLSQNQEELMRRTVGDLLQIRDEINRRLGGDQANTFSLLRSIFVGTNPTAEFLNRRLRELGVNVPVRSLDEFEIFFFRGTMAEQMRSKLEEAARAKGLNLSAEEILRKLLSDALQFQTAYNVASVRINDLISGKPEDRRKVFSDPLGYDAERRVAQMIRAHEQLEYAFQRKVFNYTSYDLKTETLFNVLRASDRAAVFFVWGTQRGGTNAEIGMGLLNSVIRQNSEAIGILRAFYNNLTNPSSKFFDKNFASKVSGDFVSNYAALLARGYTFTDIRNGVGLLLSGDKRGNLPFVEYDRNILSKLGYSSEIVRKGEVRDLAPLLARLSDSFYINLPAGVVILTKNVDSAGRTSWLYGSPLRNKTIASLYQQAAQDPTYTRTSELSMMLAGFTKNGEYNPSLQSIKVIAAKDLQEMKNNPNNFFGYVSPMEGFKNRIRTGLHKIGELLGEMYYAGTNPRATKLEGWYTAQYQMRMILESYESAINTYMTPGKGRYDPSNYIKEMREEAQSSNNKVKLLVAQTMEMLNKGSGTQLETLKATWYGFRRNIASKIVAEVAEAESAFFSAKLELRAIEKLRKEGAITDAEYRSLRSEALSKIESFKSGYKELREEYKDFNQSARYWASSHDNVYGTSRSLFTAFSPLASIFFDSKFVQGAKYDFYWITESSAMRDPRTATGAGFGLDYSFYVGYQTGQTVYERSRFYMTNALWEEQNRIPLILSYAVHKWFYPSVSQAFRDRSHYPSYLEMDAIYPGRMHDDSKIGKHDLFFPTLFAPLRKHYSSDFWRTRFQALLDYSGASSFIGAYLDTTPKDSFIRTIAEKLFTPSPHYSTEARFILSQRTLDQFKKLDEAIEKFSEVREAWHKYLASAEGSEEQREALDVISKYVEIRDRRPWGVQRAVSGSDMDEDGSRNRFMNLYVGFHHNIWKPVVPGMMDLDPITGKWRAFPQIAAVVDRAEEESKLDNLRYFNIARFDEKKGMVVWEDQLHTHDDASREVYKRESTALLHLIKYQNEMLVYSLTNTPSTLFMSPTLRLAQVMLGHTVLSPTYIPVVKVSDIWPSTVQKWQRSIQILRNNTQDLIDSVTFFMREREYDRLSRDALEEGLEIYSILRRRRST